MNIIITRLFTKSEYTHGQLRIDGTRICSTLENANALVPAGDYVVTLVKCKQYSRKMPCLNLLNLEPETWSSTLSLGSSKNLKQRCAECKRLPFVCTNSTLPCWCPQIKLGNGVHNRLDGSILVGQYNCLGSIIKPKGIFDALYERIRKSVSRGNQVILTIKDG